MRCSERGFALMITLWVLVLMSVMAMNFSFFTRYGSAGTRNFKEETAAYYAALSAYEEAVGYLLSDEDLAVDFLDSESRFWTDINRPSISGARTYGDTEVKIDITDEESRLNINTLNEQALRNLFAFAGIPDDDIAGLADSVSDWKDTDDLHRLSGAETDYYESLEAAYRAKNGPLNSPEELLLIKGFKPEYLYGDDEITPIYPMITTCGAALNINTAPEKVLEFLGLNKAVIESVMKQRTKEAGGFRMTPHGDAGTGIPLAVASTNFRIEVTAAVPGGTQVIKITSVVRRVSGAKGLELKTVYWREGIEGRRA